MAVLYQFNVLLVKYGRLTIHYTIYFKNELCTPENESKELCEVAENFSKYLNNLNKWMNKMNEMTDKDIGQLYPQIYRNMVEIETYSEHSHPAWFSATFTTKFDRRPVYFWE